MNLRPSRTLSKRVFAALGVAAVGLTMSACSSSDVSDEGQLDYACALIEDIVEENPFTDSWKPGTGENTDPATTKAMSASALVGTFSAGGADVPEEMLDAGDDLLRGILQDDVDKLQSGVKKLSQECQKRES